MKSKQMTEYVVEYNHSDEKRWMPCDTFKTIDKAREAIKEAKDINRISKSNNGCTIKFKYRIMKWTNEVVK